MPRRESRDDGGREDDSTGVTNWITTWRYTSGMWSLTSFSLSPVVNCALTTAPRTATPNTPPSSRLVFTVDAAMPDSSGRTRVSTACVIVTSAIPKPSPAIASGQVRAATLVVAVSCESVSRSPTPARRQPSTIGTFGPTRAVQRPASGPATIIATASDVNTSAIWKPEKFEISCR